MCQHCGEQFDFIVTESGPAGALKGVTPGKQVKFIFDEQCYFIGDVLAVTENSITIHPTTITDCMCGHHRHFGDRDVKFTCRGSDHGWEYFSWEFLEDK